MLSTNNTSGIEGQLRLRVNQICWKQVDINQTTDAGIHLSLGVSLGVPNPSNRPDMVTLRFAKGSNEGAQSYPFGAGCLSLTRVQLWAGFASVAKDEMGK